MSNSEKLSAQQVGGGCPCIALVFSAACVFVKRALEQRCSTLNPDDEVSLQRGFGLVWLVPSSGKELKLMAWI